MVRKNVIDKNFTYFSIIKEAIVAQVDEKATSAQIFEYMMNKHPECFTQLNSVTWKNNVRQLLSKCPEFVKTKKERMSKLHYWRFMEYSKLVENEYLRYPDRCRKNCEPEGFRIPKPRQILNYDPGFPHDMGYPNYSYRMFDVYTPEYYDPYVSAKYNRFPFSQLESTEMYRPHTHVPQFQGSHAKDQNMSSSDSG